MRYKSKPLFIKKWIKAGLKFVSHLVSGNTWRSLQDIKDEIEDYPGLQFDNSAVTNAVKREWKDTVTNATNVTNEDEGKTESNMSALVETILLN